MFIIYTDGACRRNPGPGGWGTIVFNMKDQRVSELGGHEGMTTNNRMELEAVIGGLAFLQSMPGKIRIHTDSSYVIQGITKRIHNWKQRDWKNSLGGLVANKEIGRAHV